ncbi:DNA mismatch repair endonuclease MutL [Oscillatoria sp. FACHB-1406]|nr:DNA mismatch repair endonuclease MutL [Oscillatoria sp. FACHB-1406]
MKIQPLPPEIVTLIAAGETIDSLAAAVRELVENAIDAGARRLTIALFPDLWRLQVADNGGGMDLTDLQVCAGAHCTSKIRDRADLWKIASLGFRGEALHSLAQLGTLEIASRSSLEDFGWRVSYDRAGKAIREEITAIAPGTIVTVSDLFATIPVRRSALPSKSQQLKAVQETIYHLALCYPAIAWQVLQNGEPWFNLSPSPTAKEVVPQLLKSVRASDLQYLNSEIGEEIQNAKAGIEIVLGLPDRCHRHRPDWVKVAINGRIVRSPELEQAAIAATHRTLPRDRFPVCFLHLCTDPAQIDWNRHPAKQEIYLHSMAQWRDRVAETIEQALRLSPTDLSAAGHQRISQVLKAAEAKSSQYKLNPNLQVAVSKSSAISLRAVAQVNKTYIVAEHPNGIWLVEQHIAHERILYEELLEAWQLVGIEPPLILNNLIPAQIAQLQRINLEIEPFGEQMWAVRTLPAMLQPREDCAAALLELSWGGDLQTAQVAVACRSAIRNGTVLSLPEMQDILDRWQQTRNPRTCPHGRPIYLPLEESSLARFFRRHWVIGKSHGI